MAINKYIGVEVIKISKLTSVALTSIGRICTDTDPELSGVMAFFMGGGTGISNLDRIQIDGARNNITSFGSLSTAVNRAAAVSNYNIGIVSGGIDSVVGYSTSVQQATQITGSSASMYNFGNLIYSRYDCAGFGNSTKGIISSGYESKVGYHNRMDKLTITTNNSSAYFGDISIAQCSSASGANTTRGLLFGGHNTSSTVGISYRDFATDGNMQYFGDLTGSARTWNAGCSNSTRFISAGGYTMGVSNLKIDTINYKDFSTLGNAPNFGNLSASSYGLAAAGSKITALIHLGYTTKAVTTVDSINYSTLSNSTNFSNLTVARDYVAALSNCHGGL